MVAYTTTYNLKKPTVADDEDVWGGYLNDSMDIIDDVLDGTVPVTGIDINSGTLDNVVIGGATANSGTFTVLSATTSLGVTGNITVSGTVDGVDIAARDAVLTSTTTTANAALPKAGGTMTGAITFATGQTFDGRDVSADGAKLDGIEAGATADQTAAEIRALVESATDSNVFTDADHTKLNGIEAGATADQTASEILTLIKTVDGAGSGLDADTVDGYQTNVSSSASTVVVRDTDGDINFRYGVGEYLNMSHAVATRSTDTVFYSSTDNYIRKNNATGFRNSLGLGTGNSPTFSNMYVGDNIYHNGDTDTRILFGTNTITMQTGGSSEITVNTTGVRLGDTGNGYFRPVSGSYGSIEIDGGAHGGWEGYSIGGRVVFMHDNSNTTGIYNDVNNEWMLKCDLNGAVNLYYNNSSKLDTLSNGVSINGNLYTDGSNAEDYDALSGTSPTCNVDNAGAFSLTMTGNTTFTFSGADNNWSQGFVLQLTGNGGTVTWPSSVDWAGGTAPDAPASGETDIYVFWTRDGGTTWYGVLSVDAAA